MVRTQMVKMTNKVYKHLKRQGTLCKDEIGECLYRDGKGNSCGIGGLIPDELYCPSMEGSAASALVSRFQLNEIFDGLDDGFLDDLQANLHDRLTTVDDLDEARIDFLNNIEEGIYD